MKQKLFTANFVLLILGQAVSLFGNFILKLALSMYVLDMTGSAAVFAGILSAAVIPTIFLSPFGGILADRADRRNIMVALDALSGTFVLASAVCMAGNNDLKVICALLVFLSVLGAFETPTVQACIPAMLTGDDIIRGNAVVNQIASLSYLTAPMLGGILYTAFGLKPVMYASAVCFFATALSECFIKLAYRKPEGGGRFLSIIRSDFSASVNFIFRGQPKIAKMLILTALSRFFVMGVIMVGLPYMVRTVLGLNARYYGAAESILAVATIAGSIAAGFLTGKLNMSRLPFIVAAIGAAVIPAGAVFLFPAGSMAKYAVITACFCMIQILVSVFSIFAVSFIQQKTPDNLIGKIMAYTSAITLCVQPAGQMIYGFLFDRFRSAVHIVLIPTGIIVCMAGLLSLLFLRE